MTVRARPAAADADGVSAIAIEVTVRSGGLPFPGATVHLASDQSGLTIDQPAATGSDGLASGLLRSTSAGTYSIEATVSARRRNTIVSPPITVSFASLDNAQSVPASVLHLSNLTNGQAPLIVHPVVAARDGNGTLVTSYRGVVVFQSTDATASLPAAYTFSAADAGAHTFAVQLTRAGTQSISVADARRADLAASGTAIVSPGPVATFSVAGFPKVAAVGQSGGFVAAAFDAFANAATNYTGSVRVTSSDPCAVLPAAYTYTAADAGVHSFGGASASFKTVGTQSIAVTDASNAATGEQKNIAVLPYTVTSIISGEDSDSVCALLNNKQLKCWGYNPYGELGYGDATPRGKTAASMGANLPFVNLGVGRSVQSAVSNCSDNSTGGHSCAVLDNGQVTCWGANAHGELGFGDTQQRLSPSASTVNLGSGRTASAISASCRSTCALLDNQQVACWGYNPNGQLGLGDTLQRLQPTAPANLGASRTALSIASGADATCALLDTQQLKCWGGNAYGQLGLGDTSDRLAPSASPIAFGAGRTVAQASVGGSFACAVLDDASVNCWGNNASGQLGIGDTVARTVPIELAPSAFVSQPTAVAAGQQHVCAVQTGGQLQCWGLNVEGRLGIGDTVSRLTPAPMVDLGVGRTAIGVTLGNYFTCALLDALQVKCWGANGAGALGLGDTGARGDAPNTMGDSLPFTVLW